MIEYHAHLVACLDDTHDIDDPNCEDLINVVNRHFAEVMTCFEGEEHQKICMQNDVPAYTDEYKCEVPYE